VVPFAITNPVFVDGDGDGAWRPEIAQPDPGPLDPEVAGTPWPPWSSNVAGTWDPLLAHPAPLDCEPGLEALW